MQPAKKSKKASPSSVADEVGTLTVPIVDEGGSGAAVALVDLTSGLSGDVSQPLPLAQGSRPKRSSKEVATATYKIEVEYPKDGGVFNDGVDGHDVLSQAIPAKDRTYLNKLGDVKIYDRGMDLVVQGAFMLMESNKRQQREIARLKEFEQKAASADEAMSCLGRLREDFAALQKRVDEADAAKNEALAKLAEERDAREADRRRADDAEKAKAEAAAVKAADAAVEKFLAEGWKADEHLPWCYEVVAAKLEDWGQNSPAGQEYFVREMSVYYNMGQHRMQRLLYRRLSRAFKALNYTRGWARRNLQLPKLMKDPEEQVKLPLSDMQAPIESSGLGEPDYGEDDVLADTATSVVEASSDAEAEDDAEFIVDQNVAGQAADEGVQEA
ncbi:unnamed protein product [Cuscuta europaea]|uniref:Uncharacterized protein n=1 Tax=Cuscuta europaea TaxID=41803 RepID=A0A9P0YGP9_CUSEU|nr:unnamed protein product [Cuscuta europaea]